MFSAIVALRTAFARARAFFFSSIEAFMASPWAFRVERFLSFSLKR